jgi:hypothetical protein
LSGVRSASAGLAVGIGKLRVCYRFSSTTMPKPLPPCGVVP